LICRRARRAASSLGLRRVAIHRGSQPGCYRPITGRLPSHPTAGWAAACGWVDSVPTALAL
jgi:hypothetical protein